MIESKENKRIQLVFGPDDMDRFTYAHFKNDCNYYNGDGEQPCLDCTCNAPKWEDIDWIL